MPAKGPRPSLYLSTTTRMAIVMTEPHKEPGVAKRITERLADRNARVGVIGLGYVGLPLSTAFAASGLNVLGFDRQAQKVSSVNDGRSYIADVPSEVLAPLVEQRRLSATHDFSQLATCDCLCICVPTPLDANKNPDMSYVARVSDDIAETMTEPQLVVLESTTYPGTTEEVIVPRLTQTGRTVGEDVFVAFSPERIDPGRTDFTAANTPKVVGGVTPTCTELAAVLYSTFNEQIFKTSSPRVAEMEKLLENIFRLVNVSLVNELALLCDRLNIDIWEVIDAASTKPYGFMPFYPGPGLGGHCIPIDPFYLTWKAKEVNFSPRFIEVAADINDHMPNVVQTKVTVALNNSQKCLNGADVLLLGVAYKRDVDDVRESPAIQIIIELWKKHANVTYHDPHVAQLTVDGTQLDSLPMDSKTLSSADCVVIVTDHTAFDFDYISETSQLIVDTRNAIKSRDLPHVYHLGVPDAPKRLGKE